jgi:hypothetical protein
MGSFSLRICEKWISIANRAVQEAEPDMKEISLILVLLTLCFLIVAGCSIETEDSLESGLQGLYLFNGSASDGSGNSNDGVVHEAQLTTNRHGVADAAYSFNGTSDYVDCGDSASLNPTTAVTVSAWIYLISYPAPGEQTSWVSIANKRELYCLQVNGSTSLVLTIYSGSSTWKGITRNVLPSADFALNRWYHVVSSYDSSDDS